jgi:hypothetical protein
VRQAAVVDGGPVDILQWACFGVGNPFGSGCMALWSWRLLRRQQHRCWTGSVPKEVAGKSETLGSRLMGKSRKSAVENR